MNFFQNSEILGIHFCQHEIVQSTHYTCKLPKIIYFSLIKTFSSYENVGYLEFFDDTEFIYFKKNLFSL